MRVAWPQLYRRWPATHFSGTTKQCPGVLALIALVPYSFRQARQDIAKHTEGLTTGQIWATPHGFGSVGFHIRHIAGSVDRLITYLEGKQLSGAQMAALAAEKVPRSTWVAIRNQTRAISFRVRDRGSGPPRSPLRSTLAQTCPAALSLGE